MAGRKIDGARDARACLAAARERGQTIADWSQQAGVDGRSLNAWRMNLDRGRAVEGGSGRAHLVELVMASVPDSGRVTVRCGRFSVEVDAAFDSAVLERVLRVMASC